MKRKKRKKLNLTTKLIYVLIVLIISVNVTLARFGTANNVSTTANTASWLFVLSVNDQTLSQTFQVNLTDTMTQNGNVKSGVVAPGAEGSFSLDIDCSRMRSWCKV